MYAYITGKIAEKSPTFVVLDNQGIGYLINITLNTFTAIGEKEEVRLFTHEQILEDAHNLFGFFTAKERDLFELLISVSGVGCNLKDKLKKTDLPTEIFAAPNNTIKTEALSALTILGFSKTAVDKALDKLLKQMPDASVETLIKEALKIL